MKPKESVDDYHTPVQMPDKKTVKILLQELQKRTSQDSIKIQIEENRKPTLIESKLGGVPYWDRKRKYPTTSGGSSLMLLAQINLNESLTIKCCQRQECCNFLYGMTETMVCPCKKVAIQIIPIRLCTMRK